MDDNLQGATAVRPPRGMFPAKVDDKGRLKLPAEFQRYLSGFTDKTLFVTSLDRHIATIYPVTVWEENERLLEDYKTDPDAAENIIFNANDLGADSEMDNQGRIPFPAKLRKALEIENQQVYVLATKGSIQVLSEPMYQARRSRSDMHPEADVKKLQQFGLK